METAEDMMESFVKEISNLDVDVLISQDPTSSVLPLKTQENRSSNDDPVTSLFGPHKKLRRLVEKTSRFSPLAPFGDAIETCTYRIASGPYKFRDSKELPAGRKLKHSSLVNDLKDYKPRRPVSLQNSNPITSRFRKDGRSSDTSSDAASRPFTAQLLMGRERSSSPFTK